MERNYDLEMQTLEELGFEDCTGDNDICHWLVNNEHGVLISVPFADVDLSVEDDEGADLYCAEIADWMPGNELDPIGGWVHGDGAEIVLKDFSELLTLVREPGMRALIERAYAELTAMEESQ